jgi:hypothetical protein
MDTLAKVRETTRTATGNIAGRRLDLFSYRKDFFASTAQAERRVERTESGLQGLGRRTNEAAGGKYGGMFKKPIPSLLFT